MTLIRMIRWRASSWTTTSCSSRRCRGSCAPSPRPPRCSKSRYYVYPIFCTVVSLCVPPLKNCGLKMAMNKCVVVFVALVAVHGDRGGGVGTAFDVQPRVPRSHGHRQRFKREAALQEGLEVGQRTVIYLSLLQWCQFARSISGICWICTLSPLTRTRRWMRSRYIQ